MSALASRLRPVSVSPARSLALIIGLLVVINGVVTVIGAWQAAWLPVTVANLVLLTFLARAVERALPHRATRAYEVALSLLFPAFLLVTWEVLANADIIYTRWFPAPSTVLGALAQITTVPEPFDTHTLLGEPWLIPQLAGQVGLGEAIATSWNNSHLAATISRVAIGFVLGAIPGVIVGALMGTSRTIRIMLDNTVSAIYVLPKISIFPLIMLIFGDPFGESPKYAVVALTVFFLVLFNTMAGVRGIEKIYHDVGRNYGANRLQAFWHIILPGALPMIFAGLRIALGSALIVIIAIEFLRAKSGIGYMTFYYWEVLNTPKMYAGLLVTMAMGVLLTVVLLAIERLALPWRRERSAVSTAKVG